MFHKVVEKNYQDVIDVEMVKRHLRISHNEDDNLLTEILKSSIDYAEVFLRKSICRQVIEFQFCNERFNNVVKLPVVYSDKVISCNIESSGVSSALKEKIDFIFDDQTIKIFSRLGKIVFTYQASWPDVCVPPNIVQGLLQHVEALYDKESGKLHQALKNYSMHKKMLI